MNRIESTYLKVDPEQLTRDIQREQLMCSVLLQLQQNPLDISRRLLRQWLLALRSALVGQHRHASQLLEEELEDFAPLRGLEHLHELAVWCFAPMQHRQVRASNVSEYTGGQAKCLAWIQRSLIPNDDLLLLECCLVSLERQEQQHAEVRLEHRRPRITDGARGSGRYLARHRVILASRLVQLRAIVTYAHM